MESFALDPQTTTLAYIQAFLLIFMRTTGIFERLPVLGSQQVPRQVKVWLSFFLALVLFPVVISSQTVPLMPQSMGIFLVGVFTELTVGLMIGFIGTMLLTGFQLGGRLIDDQMGFSLANVFDPTTQETGPVTSQLVFYVAIILFVVMGGLNMTIEVFAHSFQIVPLIGFNLHEQGMWYVLLEAAPQSFILGVTFAAPCIIVVTIATVALGLLGKVVPEMNIFSFSFGVRVFLGLIMLQVSCQYMPGIMENVLDATSEQLHAVLYYMGGRG